MYKRPDSDGVDGAVLIKPEPPAVGANAGGWFSALITRNRAPTKCTAAFLNEIIEEARNLADAAGVLWKTRPDDRRNLLLSVRAIVAAEAPAQIPQFTNYHSAPNDNDIGDKLVGFLWRNGCDEWRLVNNPAVPGTKQWMQVRGSKTIYTDNASRAVNSVRNLQAGNSWDDFCDLEFYTRYTGTEQQYQTSPIRISAAGWNGGERVISAAGLNSFVAEHENATRFRVVSNDNNYQYVSKIIGIY